MEEIKNFSLKIDPKLAQKIIDKEKTIFVDVHNDVYEDIERMAKGFEESIQSLSNRIHYSLSSITGGGDHGNVTDALYSIADAIRKLTKEINKNG